MNNLVLDLQREAQDSSNSLTDLLRKAYIVAKKLKITEFQKQIESEINGYKENEEIPRYREITGQLKARNYYGWVTVAVDDDFSFINTFYLNQSISELEALSQNPNLSRLIPGPLQLQLANFTGHETEYQIHFNSTQIQKILNKVRNIILEWALELEERGILGEGFSFNNDEKEKAEEIRYEINYFGDINSSQFQHHTINSNQSMISSDTFNINKVREFITMLKDALPNIGADDFDHSQLNNSIEDIEKEVNSDKPKNSKIREGLKSIRNILEGVTGSFIATGIITEIRKLLGG
ncbi:hypothetical protein BSA171_13450 [Bacillus safensis]|uniref:AbiTii domain-containing protein n=1 Tax=Bacillus safensis TaxID=561879 RepID=UPI00094BCB78|nr:hypothetical protein [Bacillus safensis]APT49187.1 hypothetical protein BSA41_04265 [Bacillus safensis]APT54535.1 hypothetical protein BSA171_13450 [Bacillus safensis]